MTVKQLLGTTGHLPPNQAPDLQILEPRERLEEKPMFASQATEGNIARTAQGHVREDNAKLSAKRPQDSQPHLCIETISYGQNKKGNIRIRL